MNIWRLTVRSHCPIPIQIQIKCPIPIILLYIPMEQSSKSEAKSESDRSVWTHRKAAEAENINEIVLKLSGRFCKLICTHYELLFLTSLIRFCLGELFTAVVSNLKQTVFSL